MATSFLALQDSCGATPGGHSLPSSDSMSAIASSAYAGMPIAASHPPQQSSLSASAPGASVVGTNPSVYQANQRFPGPPVAAIAQQPMQMFYGPPGSVAAIPDFSVVNANHNNSIPRSSQTQASMKATADNVLQQQMQQQIQQQIQRQNQYYANQKVTQASQQKVQAQGQVPVQTLNQGHSQAQTQHFYGNAYQQHQMQQLRQLQLQQQQQLLHSQQQSQQQSRQQNPQQNIQPLQHQQLLQRQILLQLQLQQQQQLMNRTQFNPNDPQNKPQMQAAMSAAYVAHNPGASQFLFSGLPNEFGNGIGGNTNNTNSGMTIAEGNAVNNSNLNDSGSNNNNDNTISNSNNNHNNHDNNNNNNNNNNNGAGNRFVSQVGKAIQIPAKATSQIPNGVIGNGKLQSRPTNVATTARMNQQTNMPGSFYMDLFSNDLSSSVSSVSSASTGDFLLCPPSPDHQPPDMAKVQSISEQYARTGDAPFIASTLDLTSGWDAGGNWTPKMQNSELMQWRPGVATSNTRLQQQQPPVQQQVIYGIWQPDGQSNAFSSHQSQPSPHHMLTPVSSTQSPVISQNWGASPASAVSVSSNHSGQQNSPAISNRVSTTSSVTSATPSALQPHSIIPQQIGQYDSTSLHNMSRQCQSYSTTDESGSQSGKKVAVPNTGASISSTNDLMSQQHAMDEYYLEFKKQIDIFSSSSSAAAASSALANSTTLDSARLQSSQPTVVNRTLTLTPPPKRSKNPRVKRTEKAQPSLQVSATQPYPSPTFIVSNIPSRSTLQTAGPVKASAERSATPQGPQKSKQELQMERKAERQRIQREKAEQKRQAKEAKRIEEEMKMKEIRRSLSISESTPVMATCQNDQARRHSAVGESNTAAGNIASVDSQKDSALQSVKPVAHQSPLVFNDMATTEQHQHQQQQQGSKNFMGYTMPSDILDNIDVSMLFNHPTPTSGPSSTASVSVGGASGGTTATSVSPSTGTPVPSSVIGMSNVSNAANKIAPFMSMIEDATPDNYDDEQKFLGSFLGKADEWTSALKWDLGEEAMKFGILSSQSHKSE
ncbi:hypothetical protein V1511DRAFT_508665 [Dipodascopsis uninucleata]